MNTRSGLAGLATLFALTLVVTLAGSEEPPSSLVPPTKTASLRLTLEQRVVRDCHSATGAQPLACLPREERTPGKTSITLRPIREASLKGRHAARAAVTFAVDSADANQTRSLAPGLWRLDWTGHTQQPTFRAEAGGSLHVKLSMRRGRCEPVGKECKLDLAATERQVEIRLQ
jgi:hypothetical protein